uniref:Putative RNA-directed DNA polymerase, eukaryota, reverse transcriptase zinc-binding domain protein n=1 Tax=Tanacetum cinerariifolium TaxID=118510 RepID=A0A6L2MXQ3_TANCI|nr:putative RNA-directed DNA polymerase, eukaryota, reverse transcriptase zinc-binding domain protein [Tanacetum cinerariifolium]
MPMDTSEINSNYDHTEKEEENKGIEEDSESQKATQIPKENREVSACSGHFQKVMTARSQELSEKKVLWDYLHYTIKNQDSEMVIIGDFNEVRTQDELFGSNFNTHVAAIFNLFISLSGLVEVLMGGCSFTWVHKSATKMSKLDRFLISKGLMQSCSNISALTLDRYFLDHRPILLREICFDYDPTHFRFYYDWFEIKGFDKFMENIWNDYYSDDPNSMTRFINKMHHLKKKLRSWTNSKKESLMNQNSKLKSTLVNIDKILDSRNVNSDLLNKHINVMNSLQDLEKLKSSEVVQKAKIKWSIEGDENSKYFYGVYINSPYMVKNEFMSHFKNRFDRPPLARLSLDMNFPNLLSSDIQVDLKKNVTKDELKRAVWDCGLDKSPNGFTFGFYRRYWSLLENDFMEVVFYFSSMVRFVEVVILPLSLLIPKTQNANMVKDYHHISLIRSLYKIIAKILVNHLVVVLGDIVSDVQSTFFADRQILDGPFTLNDLIQWCKEKKRQTMIFKVDLKRLLTQFGGTTLTTFIKAMYGKDGLLGKSVKFPFPSIWLDIICDLANLNNQGIDLLVLFKKKIGNGFDTSFWEDTWKGDTTFKFLYPRVYALENCKQNNVASKLGHINLGFSLRHIPRSGGELEQFDDMTNSRFNLSRRGLDIHSILCPICEKHAESSSHIFFACSMACDIHRKISFWWDVSPPHVSLFEDWENKLVFGSTIPSKAALFDDIVARSFQWCKHKGDEDTIAFVRILNVPWRGSTTTCLQPWRVRGSRARESNGYKLWYSGSSTASNGVGVMVAERLKENVVRLTRRSDRIMAISVNIDGETVNVISAYAPQVGLSDVDKKRLWDALNELVRECPTDERLFIRGNLNGHIEAVADGYAGVHEGFGFGDRNEEGRSILEAFPSETCSSRHRLVIVDVLFEKQRHRREATGRPRILWKNLKGEAVESFRATVSKKLSALEEDVSAGNAD